MKTLLVTAKDVERIVIRVGVDDLLDRLVDRLEEGFQSFEVKNALLPIRSGLQYETPESGLLEWMPISLYDGSASLKIVGYHPSNPAGSLLPTVISSVYTFDTSNGHLEGIIDGTFLTALRTGAISLVASRVLAHPSSEVLGMVGCGAQAVTQAHALSRFFPIRKIVVYDKDAEAAESFLDRINFLGIPVEIIGREELGDLLHDSDILCTCTSEKPGVGALFPDFRNKKGLHINAVGSDFHGKFELPKELLDRSFVCPDFLEQAMLEGECQQLSPDQVGPDLASLLNGKTEYRSKQTELTVFDSTGHALADYLTSKVFMDYAKEFGLGSYLELECIPADPKNPYSFMRSWSGNMGKNLVAEKIEATKI